MPKASRVTTNQNFSNTALETALSQTQKCMEVFLEGALQKADVPVGLRAAMEAGTLGGGKRLRPFLHLEATRLLGGDLDGALFVAGAIELVHAYSLIHDDLPCMDNASMRRGRPTVHRLYGQATALLAGNALLTLAFEVLEEAPFTPDIRLALIRCLARASGGAGMMAGQFYDLQEEPQGDPLAHVTRTQQLKTGALFNACFESALITTQTLGAHPLRIYGQNLGAAFQILDDLQDLLSNIQETGKTTGLDTHKITFVSLLGAKAAQEKGIHLLEEAALALELLGPNARVLQSSAWELKERLLKVNNSQR